MTTKIKTYDYEWRKLNEAYIKKHGDEIKQRNKYIKKMLKYMKGKIK